MKPKDTSFAQQMTAYAVAIAALFGTLGGSIAIGWYLMKKFGWPTWTIVFPAMFGLVGAFLQINRYMNLRWANEKPDSSDGK